MSDSEGLKRAYEADNKVYFHGDTLYIAGTSNAQDVWDDLKIPFGLTGYSERYQTAKKYVDNEGLGIKHIVGHSLGGAVTLQFEKDYPDRNFKTTTYGAPVVDFGIKGEPNERYRNRVDPVSIFDRNANIGSHDFSMRILKNHSFSNFKNVSGTGGDWVGEAKTSKIDDNSNQYHAPLGPLEITPKPDANGWVWPKNTGSDETKQSHFYTIPETNNDNQEEQQTTIK